MEIILKEDWDIPLRLYNPEGLKEGYFVGRNKETSALTNEIIRKNSGSIIVCGHRGVGKTSLVYKAIRSAKDKNRNIVPILVNASQLELNPNSENINPKNILVNLIRRIYSTVEFQFPDLDLNSDMKSRIEGLYSKAVASDFKCLEVLSETHAVVKEINNEKGIEISINEKTVNTILLISFLSAVVFEFVDLTVNASINKFIPVLFAFPIPYALCIYYKNKVSSIESDKKGKQKQKTYSFDNNVGNLEYDLECVQRDLAPKHKLVYVIDELDKLKKENICDMFNTFKNLFTLSDALFIFICGEEIYNKLNGQGSNTIRPVTYTYFSSKYFIPRPGMNDLDCFFDTIIDESTEIPSSDLMILKKALCFESKGDFFDLKAYIKDRIVDFDDDNRPIINYEVNEIDVQKARFQTMITALFEDKYKSLNFSKWYQNECLLRALYDHSHNIFKSYQNSEFTDPRDDSIEAELIRDFNSFFDSCGGFTFKQNVETIKIRNLDIQISTYSYNGSIRGEPPLTITSFTEYEKRFRHDFERYCDYALSIIEVFEEISHSNKEVNRVELREDCNLFVRKMREHGIIEYNQFIEHSKIYAESSERNTLRKYRRDDLSEMSKNIEIGIEALINSLPMSIEKNVSKLYPKNDLIIGKQHSKFYAHLIRTHNIRLNSHGCIKILNKEVILENKNVDVAKKYFQCMEKCTENGIYIFYLNVEEEFKLEKSQIISTDSPDILKNSLASSCNELIEYINSFELNSGSSNKS